MDAAQVVPAVVVGIGGLTSLVCGARAFAAYRGARLIAANPSTPIAQLNSGLNEVKGVLHGKATLESPLSRRPCLYWRLVLEQRRRNNWEVVLDRRDSTDVWLEDGSGRIQFAPRDADMIVSSARRAQSGIFEVPSEELSRLLESLGEPSLQSAGAFIRYREEILEDGATLFAIGQTTKRDAGWELESADGLYVVSDRDEAEVIRLQQRLGQRWMLGVVAGVLVLSLGAYVLLSGDNPPT